MVLGLGQYPNHEVTEVVLHLIGEKADAREISHVADLIRKEVGPLPLTADEVEVPDAPSVLSSKAVVLTDGSYKTVIQRTAQEGRQEKWLRRNLVRHSRVGGMLARTLGKLLFKLKGNAALYNREAAPSMLILCGLLRLYRSEDGLKDHSHMETITHFLRSMADPQKLSASMFAREPVLRREALARQRLVKPFDEFLTFRQLQGSDYFLEVEDETTAAPEPEQAGFLGRLHGLVQLTGYNDVVYSEAFVSISKCEVRVEVLMVNRRNKPLLSAAFEFISTAEHKVLERTPGQVLKPLQSGRAVVVLKFGDMSFGLIHGTFSYENSRGVEEAYLYTAPIELNIIDYVHPHPLALPEFVQKWQKYEWENKTTVTFPSSLHRPTLARLVARLKAYVVSESDPANPLFQVINLYARSLTDSDFVCCLAVHRGPATTEARLKLRSESKGLVDAIGKEIGRAFS